MVRRARKVVWTIFAKQSRTSIFLYWNNRNKSTIYSRKLNILFQESLKQLQLFPESTIESTEKNIRLQIASHFYLIYLVSDEQITILDIWDTRQNPINFTLK